MRFRIAAACAMAVLALLGFTAAASPPPPDDAALATEIGDLRKTIDVLRDRVSNLEGELGNRATDRLNDEHVVSAPFQVVDGSGKPIFTVTAGAAAQATGRVRIGHGSGDNYGVYVATGAGTTVAVLSETKDGAGSVSAYDKEGHRHLQVNGGGSFSLFSPSGKEAVSIGLNAAFPERGVLQLAGLLQIFDDAGETMVEAGTSFNKKVGVVKVGPEAKCVPLGTLRVPDCIMGRREP
jgi:hypothetical protein